MSRPIHVDDRWSRAGLTLALSCVVSALLALPSLGAPLFEDDVFHRAMLGNQVRDLHWGALELYEFIGGPAHDAHELRDRGLVPWFTPDDLKLRFFRPLSSATIALDAALFGSRTWPARLHSFSWFLVILTLVSAINRRWLAGPAADLATLVYALAAAHALPLSWIAARHALVSSALGLLAVWLHVRRPVDRRSAGAWLAPLVFLLSLFAGEMALGTLALVAAFELGRRGETISRRVGAFAIFGAIAALYLGRYVSLGYGARASGAYVGLDGGPESITTIAMHFWILAGEIVTGTPSDALTVATLTTQWIAAACGLAVVLIAVVVLRVSWRHVESRNRPMAGWLAAAAAAAALPGTFGPLGGRALMLALVPGSAVMAVWLIAAATAVRDRTMTRGRRAAIGVVLAIVVLGHFVEGPLLRLALALRVDRIARGQRAAAASAPACNGVMVLVAAADPSIALYLSSTLILEGRAPERLWLLSMAADDHHIDHVTPTGFDLATSGRGGRTIWERLFRAAPLTAGTRVSVPPMNATVVDDRDGAALRTRFDFGEPLDSPHLCFVQWRGGRLTRLAPPRPGERIELPYERGPMDR